MSALKIFAVLTVGGDVVARNVLAEDEAGIAAQYDMNGKVAIEIERAMVDFESVGLDGVIVEEAEARRAHALAVIDRDYREQHGADAIERIHLFKALRAERVLDGGTCLLIEGEATLRGVTPVELATTIRDLHIATDIEDELARMAAKLAVEQGETPPPDPELPIEP